MDELVQKVKEWGRNHDLNDPIMQFTKYQEENGEIAHELTRNRLKSLELKDALGDSLVCLIILADILGYELEDCLDEAYNEIKDRKGKTVSGSFVKEV